MYNNRQGMYALFSSINGNAFSNHIFAYVMPGEGIELGKPMTMEEAKTKRVPTINDCRAGKILLPGWGGRIRKPAHWLASSP